MVPTFPIVGAVVVVAGEVGGAEDEGAAGLDGVAALPVWASAENVNVTAPARRVRKNLLFIGSIELLGTWFRNELRKSALRSLQSTLGRTE